MEFANYRFIVGVIALVFCADALVSETHSYNPYFPSYLQSTSLEMPAGSIQSLSVNEEHDECEEDSIGIDVLQSVNEPFLCRFA